jgi:hypothetical protein
MLRGRRGLAMTAASPRIKHGFESGARCPVHSTKHPDGLTRAEAQAAFGRLREQVPVDRAAEREAGAKRAADAQRRKHSAARPTLPSQEWRGGHRVNPATASTHYASAQLTLIVSSTTGAAPLPGYAEPTPLNSTATTWYVPPWANV